MIKVLILCTGNSSRSQMAEAFLKSFDPRLEIYSAGTRPADRVHHAAIKVMNEVGINLNSNITKNVDQYLTASFDHVITVCDNARETCPVFTGRVGKRFHIGFEDPANAKGNEEEILKVFRRVRDQIRERMFEFYKKELFRE
ncbi:MAG: arsenate reductase ArsC [Bacteroidota bacterium]